MDEKKDLDLKYDLPEDCAMGTLEADDKKIVRTIDTRILPIMFLTYFLQMIDKISINVCDAAGYYERK